MNCQSQKSPVQDFTNTINNPNLKREVTSLPSILKFKDKKSKDILYEMLSNLDTPFKKLNNYFVTDYDRCNPITKTQAINDFNKVVSFATYKSKLQVCTKNLIFDGLMSSILNNQGAGNKLHSLDFQLSKVLNNYQDIENQVNPLADQEESSNTFDFSEFKIQNKREICYKNKTLGRFNSL
jgi:hypothetical protein